MAKHINIEFKAYSQKIDLIRSYLNQNATKSLGVDHQIDTYFNTKKGRLKLREGNIENSLIYYNRPDIGGSKQSDVNLTKLKANSGIREILRKSQEIKTVVDKKREIYFIDNVKFHLDKVVGLGEFIEVEAIDFGGFTKEKLQEQCDYYIEEFSIKKDDFIDVSYSDLIIRKSESFRKKIEKELSDFIKIIEEKSPMDLSSINMDHVCLRVESLDEYNELKEKFQTISDLLIESEIGGRLISTLRLYKPFLINDRSVAVIELPQPKEGSLYQKGFEHGEFVIKENFDEFISKYPKLKFDKSGLNKKHNPELKLNLSEGINLKFHHVSLEDLVEIEKNA